METDDGREWGGRWKIMESLVEEWERKLKEMVEGDERSGEKDGEDVGG